MVTVTMSFLRTVDSRRLVVGTSYVRSSHYIDDRHIGPLSSFLESRASAGEFQVANAAIFIATFILISSSFFYRSSCGFALR